MTRRTAPASRRLGPAALSRRRFLYNLGAFGAGAVVLDQRDVALDQPTRLTERGRAALTLGGPVENALDGTQKSFSGGGTKKLESDTK